jgi:hypothetical protein
MALPKEILDIQNSKLPIIHPEKVANRVLNALQGFNPFNILRYTFWILMGSLFFFSLCSVCSQSSAIWNVPDLLAQSRAPPCPLKIQERGRCWEP